MASLTVRGSLIGLFEVSEGAWGQLSALAQVDTTPLQKKIQEKNRCFICKIKILQPNIIQSKNESRSKPEYLEM